MGEPRAEDRRKWEVECARITRRKLEVGERCSGPALEGARGPRFTNKRVSLRLGNPGRKQERDKTKSSIARSRSRKRAVLYLQRSGDGGWEGRLRHRLLDHASGLLSQCLG